MTRWISLSLAVVLFASSARADDAPRRVLLEPQSAPAEVEPAFDAGKHPVITTLAISAAVVTVVALVVAAVVLSRPRERLPDYIPGSIDQPE